MHTIIHLPLGSGGSACHASIIQANTRSLYPKATQSKVLSSYLSVVSRKAFSSTDQVSICSCHVCALNLQYTQHGVSTSYKNKEMDDQKNKDNDNHVLVTNRISPTSAQTWLAGTNVFSNKQSNIQTKKQTEKSPIIQDFPKHDAKCDTSIPRVGDKNAKLWGHVHAKHLCNVHIWRLLLTVQLVHGFKVFGIHRLPKDFLKKFEEPRPQDGGWTRQMAGKVKFYSKRTCTDNVNNSSYDMLINFYLFVSHM